MALGTASLSDIWKNQILFRWRAGQGLGRATFTRADATSCATRIQHNGLIETVAANVPRTEWVDLDGDGIRETPGTLLEGSRANLLLRSEEFDNAAWNKANITATANAAVAPDGTTSADELKATASAATNCNQSVVVNDTVCTYIIFAEKGTGATDANSFGVRNTTTATDLVFGTLNYDTGIWTYTVGSTGVSIQVLPKAEATGNVWYRITIVVASGITSGNTLTAYAGFTGAAETANERAYFWGACLTAGINHSYIKTVASSVTRAAESLTIPFNFGPIDLTVLVRLARPVWADVTGTIGNRWILIVGTTVPALNLFAQSAGRNWAANLDTIGTDTTQTTVIPTGATLNVSAQFKNLLTGGQAALDVGSGLTAFSSAASGFTGFGNQTLRIGSPSGEEFYGVLLDLMIVRGLKTRQDMIALAGRD